MTSCTTAHHLRRTIATLTVPFAAALSASADEHDLLAEGVHRGTMRLSGIPAQKISLVVAEPGEDAADTTLPALRIVTEDRAFALTDVELDDDRLEFTFEPGFEVRCALKRVEEGDLEGDFEGQCDAEDDSGGRLRLSISGSTEPETPPDPDELPLAEVTPQDVEQAESED